MNIPPRPMNQTWSGDDCIDVTLLWLKQYREKLDDAIKKIEAVRQANAGSVR